MTNAWEYYGEPDPLELSAAATRFFSIATMAYERFGALPAYDTYIKLIPLKAGGKRPAQGFLPSKHTVPKSRGALALVAADYPDANVGICGHSGPGGIMVLDIDEPGTRERIEREYGPLPVTYTTRTRPVSKPYKEHVYLMQTEHLLKFVNKQVTDVTHIAGYDLKCAGGWGYVAAEGSVRDGETIIALHDVPIVPIPDSLVDWLAADVATARAMKTRKANPEPEPEPEPEPKPEITSPHPFAVERNDRNWAIASRIRTWKNTGMTDEQIMPVLLDHIRRYFEDGEQLLADKAYIRKLRGMIRRVPTLGDISYRNLTHRRRRRRRDSIPLSTVRERFKSCPPHITMSEARCLFSVQNAADERRLIRQFHAHGYVSVGPQGSHARTWCRPALALTLSPSVPNPSLYMDRYSTGAVPKEPQHRKVSVRRAVQASHCECAGYERASLTFLTDTRNGDGRERTAATAHEGAA